MRTADTARVSPGDAPFPPARIAAGPAYEVVAELAAFTSGPARPSLESGKAWIREVRRLAGPELLRRVEGWSFGQYADLATVALDASAAEDPARLVRALRREDPETLRRRLIGADSGHIRAMASDGAFERALAGDAAARTELRSALRLDTAERRAFDRVLATDPNALRDDIAGIVDDWSNRVSPAFAERARTLTERDVANRERLFRDLSTQEALRIVTSGVEMDPRGWATEIVVIPTVALRPFIAHIENGTRLVLLCSVGDEAFDDDPAAPPRRLVKAAAALGDPLRLRILRELRDGEKSATTLGDQLGMDRATIHHHLGILRSAGLLTVRAAGVQAWQYSIRREGVAGTSAALSGYLGETGPDVGG